MEKNSYSLQRNTGLIGRYVIQEVLGQGGFGITYLGIDKLYGNKVAIKEYYPQKIAMRKAQYEDVVTVTSIEEKNNYNNSFNDSTLIEIKEKNLCRKYLLN